MNIFGITQEALRTAFATGDTDRWLDRLEDQPTSLIDHDRVIAAIDAARGDHFPDNGRTPCPR